jgi:hypothetical protein
MGSPARTCRRAAGPALALALALVAPARANEVQASSHAAGIRIHDATETLRQYCSTDADGRTWLALPGSARLELITSTADPAIANPGDGTFHPFDESAVRAALAAVRYPLEGLNVEIFLLPFPRRDGLESCAGPGLILLSPGVGPLAPELQNAQLVHELGHVVQYRWLPDGDPRWADYRDRRGIEDPQIYSAVAAHANRPHEIFAEDFRALFGGSLATYSGSIENALLAYPSQVPGLATFLLALPTGDPAATLHRIGADPARGTVLFAAGSSAAATLDLFDVVGRRLVTLVAAGSGGERHWSWDGRDERGARVPAGMVFARLRGTPGATARFTWLP